MEIRNPRLLPADDDDHGAAAAAADVDGWLQLRGNGG